MGMINVLDKMTAEKIAAGEVCERPASVIKELCENSIDAGATSVTIEIKQGGKTYMRVTDNGCGMEKEDAKKAFLRHATSKIKTSSDLSNIHSLGFRGEALASISAVSRTELLTKRKELSEGTLVIMEGGEMVKAEGAGCPDGTTFVVRNLFYNTPARMKFMKKDSVESSAVLDVCHKQALSHPEVSIRVIRDSKEVLFTPGDNILRDAAFAVLGKEIASSTTEVDFTRNGVHVYGLTGKNNLSRPNRLMQICFVNGRCVVNRTILSAISDAYKNELMVGRFPVAILNVDLDASLVDVNVHPGKTEIKFAEDVKVYEAVYWSVKNAISRVNTPRDAFMDSQGSKKAYKMPFEVKQAPQQSFFKNDGKKSKFAPYSPLPPQKETGIRAINEIREAVRPFEGKLPVREIEHIENAENQGEENKKEALFENIKNEPSAFNTPTNEKIYEEKTNEENVRKNKEPVEMVNCSEIPYYTRANSEKCENLQEEFTPMVPSIECVKIIGQLFLTYILVEYDDKFMLIDQHAAHERIRYEEIKKNNGKVIPQMVLMPISVSLTPGEKILAVENKDFLLSLGFETEDFGENTIVLRSLPSDAIYEEGKDLFIELLQILSLNGEGEATRARDKAIYTVACRSALKANKPLSMVEMEALYKRIYSLSGVSTCPHGRPIVCEMNKYRIEKMFKRV